MKKTSPASPNVQYLFYPLGCKSVEQTLGGGGGCPGSQCIVLTPKETLDPTFLKPLLATLAAVVGVAR